jgi:uncharacterized glyoxalase superfamily protein PhnB
MTDTATAFVWPSLGYRDAPKVIDWLVDAFGLTKDLVVADTDGAILHSELGWRGGVINIVSYQDGEDTLTTVPGKAGIYLIVEDPDAHYKRALAAHATIVRPLTDHDYGSRGYTARDPEGNAWSFGTYAGAVAAR